MKGDPHSPRCLRFGLHEIDLDEKLLTRRGTRLKLQGQAFEVLAALLERPGCVVTNEEFRKRLWPDGTFVDFEHSIREAVLKVRRALGDSAGNPRFIETVPREGYRFIAPTEALSDAGHKAKGGFQTSVFFRRGWPILLAGVGISLYWWMDRSDPSSTFPSASIPVTSQPGSEWVGSFSPDGRQLAYFHCEPGLWIEDGNCDLYVKLLGTDQTIRLTDYPLREEFAEWSPDGRWIAFLRHEATRRATHTLVSPLGGREVELVELGESDTLLYFVFGKVASWFPDSRRLVVTRKPSAEEPLSLFLFRLDGGESVRLTHPEPGSVGDGGPAVSPDGRRLLFTRLDEASKDLFLLDLSPDSTPSGEPIRLTFDGKGRHGVVWAPSGREIIYACDGVLWRMPVLGTTVADPRAIVLPDNYIRSPAVSGTGGRLAYTSGIAGRGDLWRVELSRADQVIGEPSQIARSTRSEQRPAHSPDGKYIAFASDRSGSEELWRCDADGSNVMRLASVGGSSIRSLVWSPDGGQIAFGASARGSIDIYLVAADGGIPEQKTFGPFDHFPTAWSPDGQWLHFVSNRGGELESWRLRLDGGEPEKTFPRPGLPVFRSKAVEDFFVVEQTRPAHARLWRVEQESGRQIGILDSVFRGNLAIREAGLYFIPKRDLGCRCYHLQYLDWSSGEVKTLLDLDTAGDGLSVSPDGRSLVYTSASAEGVDIILVENFDWN